MVIRDYGTPDYKWDGNILRILREISRLSTQDFALKIGMLEDEYKKVESGDARPSIDILVKISDYSGASIDYLMGRSHADYDPLEMCKIARRGLFHDWVKGGRRPTEFYEKESFWPYNFLEAVLSGYIDKLLPLSEDQIEGVNEALNTLEDRQRLFLTEYYKDERSKAEIGRRYHVSGTTVANVIQEAMRKIRYGNALKYIKYGKAGADITEKEGSINTRLMRVERQTELLDKKLEILKQKQAEFDSLLSEVDAQASAYAEKHNCPKIEIDFSTIEMSPAQDMDIDELELSVRSYNCLKRAGIHTVGELIDKSPEELMKVRNLGKKGYEEVLDKIRELRLSLRQSNEPLLYTTKNADNTDAVEPRLNGYYYDLEGVLNDQCQKIIKFEPESSTSGQLFYASSSSGRVYEFACGFVKPVPYTISENNQLIVEEGTVNPVFDSLIVFHNKVLKVLDEPKEHGHLLDSEPLQTTYLHIENLENKEILSGSHTFYESRGYVKYVFYADGTLNIYRGVKHGFLSKEKDPYTWMEYQTDGRYMRYNDYLLISERDKNDASKHNDILYVISENELCREAYVCEKDKKEIMELFSKNKEQLHK